MSEPAGRHAMIDRRRVTRLLASALSSTLVPVVTGAPAVAQAPSPSAWPNRFVRLVVPFPPGGGTDAVARILANRLSELWGQQMVIENKGGAGSNIGAEAVARSEPDGYTVLIGSLPLAVNRYLYSSLSYDPLSDFAPVSLMCIYPNLMVVPNSSPARSVPEFIAHAKANPGKITFASSGTGTSPHLSGELFKRMTGIEMTHVPYRGVAPALNDVIPGRVDVMFNTMAGVLQQARSGQLRGLAVTSAKQFPTAPEFPPVADFVPGFDVSSWYAFLVPVKTPAEIVQKLNADTVAILREPAIRGKLEQVGVMAVGSTPAELAARLKSESEMWGPVIKAAGIKPQG
jgi:tripartite-type tricarboxylate transporter receptor subunit TctC